MQLPQNPRVPLTRAQHPTSIATVKQSGKRYYFVDRRNTHLYMHPTSAVPRSMLYVSEREAATAAVKMGFLRAENETGETLFERKQLPPDEPLDFLFLGVVCTNKLVTSGPLKGAPYWSLLFLSRLQTGGYSADLSFPITAENVKQVPELRNYTHAVATVNSRGFAFHLERRLRS